MPRTSRNVMDLRSDSPTRDPMLDYHRRLMNDPYEQEETAMDEVLMHEFLQFAKARQSEHLADPRPLSQQTATPNELMDFFYDMMTGETQRDPIGPNIQTWQDTHPPTTFQRRK